MDDLVIDNDDSGTGVDEPSSPSTADDPPDEAAGPDLTALGVHETAGLSPEAADTLERATRRRRTRGIFVRGSTGTDLVVRITSILAWAVALVVLSAAGYGVYLGADWARDAVFGTDADPALVQAAEENGWLHCLPAGLDEERIGGLRYAPAVVLGTRRLPRDPETIRSIEGATTHRSGGDRIDQFQPVGRVKMAVRYRGESMDVRHVTLHFPEPADPCHTLERLALLPAEAVFQLTEEGYAVPRGGQPAFYFRSGGLVQLQLRDGKVPYARLRSRTGGSR